MKNRGELFGMRIESSSHFFSAIAVLAFFFGGIHEREREWMSKHGRRRSSNGSLVGGYSTNGEGKLTVELSEGWKVVVAVGF